MLVRLRDANRPIVGGKAATLGTLLREGFAVPDGFVVPYDWRLTSLASENSLRAAVSRELARLGDPVVAVRSSAPYEDAGDASAAGQYESIIGVQGTSAVCQAIARCRRSAIATRVADYRTRMRVGTSHPTDMAVLVQRVIEADVSGVMFTPQQPKGPTRIEASWGLGLTVVGGTVTPDSYEISGDGTNSFSVGRKQARIDLDHQHGGVAISSVSLRHQVTHTLGDGMVAGLAALGGHLARTLGGPQDVEWAISDGTVWILQARPITAALPATRLHGLSDPAATLFGTPGAHGKATAEARIVRGPSDFESVRRGDILVCPYTDPAWTPLFTMAAGVVTETGGALSHAAIVAREYGIPAVLAVSDATARIHNGAQILIDGTAGRITVL